MSASATEDDDIEVMMFLYRLFFAKIFKKMGSCKCKRSRCLKKYCECFVSGRACTDMCSCVGCENTQQEEEKVKTPEKTEIPVEKTEIDKSVIPAVFMKNAEKGLTTVDTPEQSKASASMQKVYSEQEMHRMRRFFSAEKDLPPKKTNR
jgi:hypothetical protein